MLSFHTSIVVIMRSGKKAAAKKKQEEPVSPEFSRSGLCDYLGIYRESCCLVCTAKASAAPTLTLAHFFRAFFSQPVLTTPTEDTKCQQSPSRIMQANRVMHERAALGRPAINYFCSAFQG